MNRLRTLRRWLLISHVLPLLSGILVVGTLLVYLLETQVVRVNFLRQLESGAALVAELARADPAIWEDRARAEDFVQRINPLFPAQLMLVDRSGTLLASSDSGNRSRQGQLLDLNGFDGVLQGHSYVGPQRQPETGEEVSGALMPVLDSAGAVIGAVQLTDEVGSLVDRLIRLRFFMATALVTGTVIGATIAWRLAIALDEPIDSLTTAVERLAKGHSVDNLREDGPVELRRLSQAFNILKDRLHHLDRSRRHLLANLIHELGRPIGSLTAAITALASGAADDLELRAELLEGMREEAVRLRGLLDELATVQEGVLGTRQLQREPVVLSRWLRHIVAPWRAAAQEKGLAWEASIPPDLPVLELDPVRLGQVIGNLLSNAIKFTPAEGQVMVRANRDDGKVWIEVLDTGVGIAPDDQSQIFEPLFRSPSALRFAPGVGLGLSIARDIVLAHDGCINVESTPGEGSRFTVTLPVLEP